MNLLDPGALTGAMLAGGFGIAWSLWGASGLSGEPAVAVRVAGIVIGALILLGSAWLQGPGRRATPEGRGAPSLGASGSLFSAPSYRLVVAAEVLALIGGSALLGGSGHSEYTVAWFAGVVGVHFVIFGRLFWSGFYCLGAAILAGGIAGAVVGFAGGGPGAIRAVAGLITAASLFAAGGWTVLAARAILRA